MTTKRRIDVAAIAMAAAVMAAAAAQPTTAATVFIDDGDPGYLYPGGISTTQVNGIFNDYQYNFAPTATATYSPALTGDYYVQVFWDTFSTHESQAVATINGATTLSGSASQTFDQRLTGAQGNASSPLAGGGNFLPSGWVTLGRFTLNAGSTVTWTSAAPDVENDALVADAVRFSSDSLLVSAQGPAFTSNNPAAWINYNVPTANNGGDPFTSAYVYNTVANTVGTYTPGVDGAFRLELSWGVYPTHDTTVEYVIDIDGLLGTTGDQTTILIDQSLYADGTPEPSTAGGHWSGFYDAGDFLLNANSVILVRRAGATEIDAFTADVLRLTQVPAPAALPAGLAALGALALRRRRR